MLACRGGPASANKCTAPQTEMAATAYSSGLPVYTNWKSGKACSTPQKQSVDLLWAHRHQLFLGSLVPLPDLFSVLDHLILPRLDLIFLLPLLLRLPLFGLEFCQLLLGRQQFSRLLLHLLQLPLGLRLFLKAQLRYALHPGGGTAIHRLSRLLPALPECMSLDHCFRCSGCSG